MDFKQFFQAIRRRWITIVLLLVIALAISAFVSFRAEPVYESKARVFISSRATDAAEAYGTSFFITNRVPTYADLATSSGLMNDVIDDLGLPDSPGGLAGRISAEVVPDTSIISVTVLDHDPREARRIADHHATRYAEYLTSVETPDDSDQAQILATVTDPATYNPEAVAPKTALNMVVAGLIGLLAGIGTALAREVLDRTVHSQDHVQELTASPVLASVGFDKELDRSPLLTDLGSFAPRTEAFRLLRTNLQFLDLDSQPRCLVISSAVPGEGKTMTSTNLAVALAQTGRRTLLIDGDLRRPRIAGLLDLDPAIGLTTALVGRVEVKEAIQVHEPSGLHFLASGAKPPNPTEILQSQVTKDLIRDLSDSYDMVIIDAPPLLPVADASVLSTVADGTLLVVKHGRTTRDQVKESITRLEHVGGRLFGVVVNMVPRRASGSYYYYYYYAESDPERPSG